LIQIAPGDQNMRLSKRLTAAALRASAAAFLALLLAACASQPVARPATAAFAEPDAATQAPRQPDPRDRAAILAMAGEFRVRFKFDETLALAPDYELKPSKRSGATEWVTVVEQRTDFISLQHILVMGDEHTVVKHWRQDWQYQPARLMRFLGDRSWQMQPLSQEQAAGQWSQTVYEVDDSPRYAGIGIWRHQDGVSSWESDRVWRPLPRREYTTRDDYQVLEVVNRHVITPNGWAHEQDNTKLVVGADGHQQALVRESGLNTYRHIDDYDFEAGREYWRETASFWADVRRSFDTLMATPEVFALHAERDDEPLYAKLFELADRVREGESVTSDAIDSQIAAYRRTP
jgi:hypothetical protein